MTKPDDIPQDVWHEADELWCRHTGANALVTAIARAIMAEREACAQVADEGVFDAHALAQATEFGHGSHTASVNIAAAIRNRGAA